MRIIWRAVLCAAVYAASIAAASGAEEDPAARLRHARSLRCTYQSSVGTWVRSGHRTVEEDKDNGVATYDNINLAKGTARIIANVGASDLKAWLARDGSLWLVESTPLGYEVITTVFPMYVEGSHDELVVLESRHSLAGFIALGQTSYGTCKIWE